MVAVVAETVVIAVMILVMLQLRMPQYVVPLVAVIVGTHFFLFVRPGDRAVHIIAGVAGVVIGLAGITLVAGGSVEPLVVRGIVGCCFAVVTAYYGCYFLTWRFTSTEQEAARYGSGLRPGWRSATIVPWRSWSAATPDRGSQRSRPNYFEGESAP